MIVVGGDNLIDMVQSNAQAQQIQFTGTRGGSSYNTALAIGRQQADVGFIAPLSTDSLGQFMAQGMQNDGVAQLTAALDLPSSLAVVTFADGQPQYQFYRDGTAERAVRLDQLNRDFPKNAVAFHLSSLAITDGRDADIWAEFYIQCARQGIICTLDPNIRAMMIKDRVTYLARLNVLLAHSTVVKLSDEDLEWIYPDLDQTAALHELIKQSTAKLVVLTKGADGAIGVLGDDWIEVPAAPVAQMADTVGAGDTFMATLLAQLWHQGVLTSHGLSKLDRAQLTALLQIAAKAAAINCLHMGCNPPNLAQLQE